MAHDARAVANFFIEKSWHEHGVITHLSLQKIIFFAHAWHLAKYDLPLVGQKFEAWQYGPVVRVVYDQLKDFKDRPINTLLKKLNLDSGTWEFAASGFGQDEATFLTDLFQYYSKFHAGKLVDLTHESEGPWEKIWKFSVDNAVPGMVIPDEEIKIWILRGGGRGGKAH